MVNTQPDLFPYFIITFIVITVTFSVYYSNRKRREALRKLIGCLDGHIAKFSCAPTLNGELQGLKFSIVLIPPGKNSPPYLNVSLFKDSGFRFRIYKEGFLSNLGKKLGIVHEVITGDALFDQQFLIFSNDPTQAMVYFSNSAIRNTVKEVFDSGFHHILATGKQITIQKTDYVLENDLDTAFITGILQKLILLSKSLAN